jgi:phosphatidylglycerophosphate synthase
VFRGKIKVNRVGKAATAVLMASVAVVMYRPGVSGEILGEVMFYTGLGLSLVAGVLYVGTIKGHVRGDRSDKTRGGSRGTQGCDR